MSDEKEQAPWLDYETQKEESNAAEDQGPWSDYKSSVTVEAAPPNPIDVGIATGAPLLGAKVALDAKNAIFTDKGLGAFKHVPGKTVVDSSGVKSFMPSGGMQGYLNSQINAPGTLSEVKLAQLEKLTGMPVRTQSEVQAALASLKGAAEIPATPSQRVPVTKLVDGVQKVVRYDTIPGTPGTPAKAPVDFSELAKENYGPVRKALEARGLEKPVATAMKYASPILNYAAKPLAIAGGIGEFQDAYNRYKHGDFGRAAVSAVGGLGSLATMVPHPATKMVGAGLSLAAPALNYAIDKTYGREGYAQGGDVKKSPASIAGTLQSVGTTQGPSLASIWSDHLASLPQKTEDNLRHQQEVMGRVMPMSMNNGKLEFGKADPEAMNEFVNTMMPIGGMTKLVKDPVTKILRMSEALAPHEGKVLNITQSDRMRSTMGDLGGPGFSKFQLEHPDYAKAQAAWGVGNQPTASRIVNVNKKYPEGQAIWSPMIGSETQHHSNQHVYDMLSDEFNRQASMGNLPPELRERINMKLAGLANKEGKNLFAQGIDVANPETLKEAGKTFEQRAAMANLLAGNTVGGAKGRIIDYPGIMQEMTDPMTVGAPTHSVGTRLFTLNNQVENRPDLHSAFPYILKGEDQGVAFAPVPKELAIADWINNFKDFKGRDPGYMDLTRNTPSQQITEQYLRNLEAAGHAEGGLIEQKLNGLAALQQQPKNEWLENVRNADSEYKYWGAEMADHGLQDKISWNAFQAHKAAQKKKI